MIKIFSFFQFFLLLQHYAFAQQPCNDEAIMNTKGSWKKLSDANIFPDQSFPKNQFAQVNSRIDKMQQLLQLAYPEPKGMEASWYHNITGNAAVKGGPVPYELDAAFHTYFCNAYDKKIELGGETSTNFYIWSNQLYHWIADPVKMYVIQQQPVYLLPKKRGELNGYALYEGPYNGVGSDYSRAIIITRTGQSPYLPVTQKQFLKAFLNDNETGFAKDLAFQKNRTVKTDQEEEVEKKKYIETLERITPADKLARAKDNFLQHYITSKQRKEATIAATIKNHERDIKPAQDRLADSLNLDLEQPAILDFDNLLLFKTFSTEEKGGRQLVRLNPGYFNRNLPRYVPQFLMVYWSWGRDAAAKNWRAQVEKNFDFNALKEMIDK
jgi:hypothetical protein